MLARISRITGLIVTEAFTNPIIRNNEPVILPTRVVVCLRACWEGITPSTKEAKIWLRVEVKPSRTSSPPGKEATHRNGSFSNLGGTNPPGISESSLMLHSLWKAAPLIYPWKEAYTPMDWKDPPN